MSDEVFDSIKEGILNLDPVYWIEKNLTIDGNPFRLTNNGYKPFVDIYRYVGSKALEKDALPVIFTKARQIGGTSLCNCLEAYFMGSGLFGKNGRPPIRIMHCFPILALAWSYSKGKFDQMVAGSRQIPNLKKGKPQSILESKFDTTVTSNNSLSFKQFENGNQLWIESTGLTGDRLRGRTVDCIFYDEMQDMKSAALGASKQMLSKALYGKIGEGVQLYFGTPKQSGSDFWKIWKQSSQQYYHLGCVKCKQHFPFYTPGSDDWEKIWIEDDLDKKHPSHGFIVKCAHCGHEQDKRESAEIGKWVSYNPDPKKIKFIGFHLNQLYMPTFTRAKIISEKPENSAINTERAYQNEVLGEFFSGASAPMTAEQIHNLCADFERKMPSSISNKKTYAGFDWGQKADADLGEGKSQGKSYSCGVIITPENTHILNIEFVNKFKKNDPQYKKDMVEEMFRRYNITLAVGDIGFANDLTYNLQMEYGDKFLASRSMNSNVKNHLKYVEDIFPKEVQFDRDYLIAEVYDMMRNGKIRFPFGHYEQIAWFITDCCALETKVTLDRFGTAKSRYVKNGTCDAFFALLNAVIAWKYDISNGFKITNPNNMDKDPTTKKQIPALLGHLPKYRGK